ncbi:adenosylmethionine--8-amino-7-oxononanoate transaminase [Leptospira sp. GIMC2001]|nr:adenosylmethionine--8-amino-7-oxononanoate transaminase [Leptospira sp. GIMC2001]WCL51306.1 adenosylmethionine--8-amino-7-oxononanoate transaminase [Leptospira sp. GIMC2001]
MTIQRSENSLIRIERGEGEFIYTDKGAKIIDAISSWWTVIHGHNHPHIMDAIRKQTSELDHVIFAGFTHPKAELLARKILNSTKLNNEFSFSKVFFSDNGSNAIEIALKIALQFFRNRNKKTDHKRKSFVRFSLSYHGDSIGAMSVGGDSVFTRIFRDLAFPTKEFQSPNCVRCPYQLKPESCSTECLDDFRKSMEQVSEDIVAVILEPLVSGANGMVFHSDRYLREVRRITQDYGILLILDEVFTGMYRTGSWYAFQKATIKPDIVCLAKGLTGGTLPLALTLTTDEIYSEFDSPDPNKAFFHGHTMSGNPLACAAAIASMEILEESGANQVKSLETKLNLFGNNLLKRLGDRIRDFRVLGAIAAFEVEVELGRDEYLNPVGAKIRKACLDNGVLIRPLGNTVYITPPYNIAEQSLETVFTVLTNVLEKEFTH